MRGVFQAIEDLVPGIKPLSYADDLGSLAQGNSVSGVCRQLERAAAAAIQWGHANGVQFNPSKTEAVLFARSTGREFRKKVRLARVRIGTNLVAFNPEATRWLGVLLDNKLTLKAHYKDRLQKA